LDGKAEVREIFRNLKALLRSQQEMGLEAPRVSKKARRYLRSNARKQMASVGLDEVKSLDALEDFIGDCRRCKLHHGRTRLVFGEGSSKARLVFIGEGPGRDEDKAGRPFVGEAGKLLTDIIEKGMKLKRQSVYICNVVKCRPPGNRDPERDEIDTCLPFLKRQLQLIQPEVICTLGRVAGKVLMGEDFKITQRRGAWHSYEGVPLMPTFHPAYILRNPGRQRELKRQVWEDVKEIMKRLGLEV
jgi:DNA polymerase